MPWIASEYIDWRGFTRVIWWGKGKNYQILNKSQEPTRDWKIENAVLNVRNAEKRCDKLPSTMWIDGRPFDLDNSVIVSLMGARYEKR